jgi:hypothetical protein
MLSIEKRVALGVISSLRGWPQNITPSLHLPVDDAEHQLQVLCDPRFPAFISSQSRHQLVPAGLGDKDGGGGGVLLDLLP